MVNFHLLHDFLIPAYSFTVISAFILFYFFRLLCKRTTQVTSSQIVQKMIKMQVKILIKSIYFIFINQIIIYNFLKYFYSLYFKTVLITEKIKDLSSKLVNKISLMKAF